MVLSEGFALAPWYYLVPLVIVLGGIVGVLWTLEPPVTDRTVLAFAPWMMLGSTLHVLSKMDTFPPHVDPLFGEPTVYVSTAVVAGLAWVVGSFLYAAGLQRTIARFVGITGTGFFAVFAMFALLLGWQAGSFEPFWPVIAVVVAGLVTAITWLAVSLWFTDVAAVTSITGVFVIFAHALDGVTTAVGWDLLAANENVTVSRYVLEAGEVLPTAEYVGAGWLFVLLKVLLAASIVGLFAGYVREKPRQARVILGLVAAVGLGPAVHNLLLFTVA